MKTILILILLAAASMHCRPVYSGGDQWDLPQGGDCYLFSNTPTNEKQHRVMTELGWNKMPLVKKYEISLRVARGEAEWLQVQDDAICGPVSGPQQVYATWYWRSLSTKQKKR